MAELWQRGWIWFKERAHSTHAKVWLFILAFSESSFFLIPPDTLLVPMLLANSSRWLYYASLVTVASVLGSIFGYIIGVFFYDTIGIGIIEFYNLSDEFYEVGESFNKNTFWVMFLAAFTPIPFKVFVLSGGLFKVNIVAFILASILGRGLRFVLVSYITHMFGGRVTYLFVKYNNIATVVLLFILILFIFSYFSIPLI